MEVPISIFNNSIQWINNSPIHLFPIHFKHNCVRHSSFKKTLFEINFKFPEHFSFILQAFPTYELVSYFVMYMSFITSSSQDNVNIRRRGSFLEHFETSYLSALFNVHHTLTFQIVSKTCFQIRKCVQVNPTSYDYGTL